MKDRQVDQTPARSRVPILSTLLHCISMTTLLFLRSGFGYSFLRPKSIFLASSWAFILYCVYASIEGDVWERNRPLCLFGIAAIALYGISLTWAVGNEIRGTATHDSDSGTPHILRILQLLRIQLPPEFRVLLVLWLEPSAILLAALAIRAVVPAAESLSTWLLICAPCMWLKEAINFWFQVRQRKRQHDTLDDAEENLEANHAESDPDLPTASRRAKVRRQRAR